MSLFTDITKHMLGSDPDSAKDQSGGLAEGLLDMLQDENGGGFEELRKRFQQQGLGGVLSSWISTGPNEPIDPGQITEVLGPERVESLSRRAGIPPGQGESVLSQFLPAFIDKLTPDGKAPESGRMSTIAKIILAGLGVAPAARAAAPRLRGENEAELSESAKPAASSMSGSEHPAEPAEPPATPETLTGSDKPRTYTVGSDDTLSAIAGRFYGDALQWQRIYDANRDVLKNPNGLFPGQVLRIP